MGGTWEPYARPEGSTLVGELLVNGATGRELAVLLPPSYGRGGGRYPVLYAHDGQNLFDDRTSHAGEWRVDETMAALAAEGLEAIVVGIANADGERASEYTRWPHPEYGGGEADAYLSYLLGTVRPLVKRSFRTSPLKAETGTVGSSLGALVSLYAFFSHPGAFGFAGALSLALWGGDDALAFFERAPFVDGRIWLDVGDSEELDRPDVNAWYVERHERMAALLARKGYGPDRLRSLLVPGGVHREHAWAERFPDVVRFWLGS